jgi:hypothetical protein
VPLDQALLGEINAFLGAGINHNLTAQTALDHLFEAFTLGLALSAARTIGGTMAYETANGLPAAAFRFRMKPGYIYSPTQPTITHAVVSIGGDERFEIHLDVRVAGRSAVLHEADVLVLTRAEGRRCRLNSVHPRAAQALAALEAKYYTGTVELALAREFIGLTSDLLRDGCFVTNTRSDQVAKLLAAKDREWQDDVRPGEPGVIRVKTYFEDAMRRHLARG